MKLLVALALVSFAVGAYSQCTCQNSKWAMCDGNPCVCNLLVGDNEKVPIADCTKLIPKCFLMKAQMRRARKGQDTRTIGGKPVETAFVDNDGVYDPECENNGKFKAKQCNNTEECWCVNSAGVRRTDKGDKDIKCEEVVETYWMRLQMVHKELTGEVKEADLKTGLENAFLSRYQLPKEYVKEIQYDKDSRMVVVDVKKEKGDRKVDFAPFGWYLEKDIKELPQFLKGTDFEASVGGQKMQMEKILVYYVDEQAPTFTMKHLTGGVIAVIVVVILAVLAGLLVLFFLRRREQARYSKAQPREMDNM